MAESAYAPILLHQDHPGEDRNIIRTLRRGYYSVMYDGGHLPLADNIRETRRFLEIAHAAGANLESEVGLFGGEYQAVPGGLQRRWEFLSHQLLLRVPAGTRTCGVSKN